MPPASPLFWKTIDPARRRVVAGLSRLVDPSDGRLWDRLAFVVFAVLVGLVALTFRDYGITTDEHVQQVYGEKLWAFYLSGFADRSAFNYENLYLYGGLFDMVAVALQHILPFETYDTRHLLCALVGVLGVIGTWRLARQIGGPRVGFIAAALFAVTASWYGAMFNNTKDIPFAVGMTWLLYLTCRIAAELPHARLRHVVWFGVVLGLTLAVRVGAAFGAFYLGIAVAAHLLTVVREKGWYPTAATGASIVLALLPALPVALVVTAIFWPWAVLEPGNMLIAARDLTHFQVPTVFNSSLLIPDEAPILYLPTYLILKTPELTLLGIIVAVGKSMALACSRDGKRAPSLPWLIVTLAIVVPVAYVLITHPAIYHGMRHFFFLLPAMCVLAAAGIDTLITTATRFGQPALVALSIPLLLAGGQCIWMMLMLHPHQYVYYNMLAGGVNGANKNFEMDYWQNFVPEAMKELVDHVKAENGGRLPDRIFRVEVCGSKWLTRELLPPNFQPARNWDETDFFVATTNAGCADAGDGKVIIEIERLDVVLGVVKDRRPGTMAQGTSRKSAVR